MPTDVISKIGASNTPTTMDYSTLQAWEDACPANLVTDDKRWIGECYDQGAFSAALTLSGATTDSTRYQILRCATGASFKDKAGVRSTALTFASANGVSVSASVAYGAVITCNTNYARVEGMQVKNTQTSFKAKALLCWTGGTTGTNVQISNCILDAQTSGNEWAVGATGPIINCLIIQRAAGRGVVNVGASSTPLIYGCTIVAPNGNGTNGAGSIQCKNTAIFGFSTPGAGTGSSYCATDAASLTGTNHQTSLTFASQFQSSTVDFRAIGSGSLDNNGTPDSTNTPTDITGSTRSASTPTIGCWEVLTPDYTFSGPSSGNLNAASTNFSIDLGVHTETVTPATSGTGTFTPSTVTGPGVQTFTYTPTSASGSPHTISVSDSGSLTDPSSLTYTVIPPATARLTLKGTLGQFDATAAGSTPADGGNVKRWEDQTSEAMHFTEATNPPTRRDTGVNSTRSTRFASASSQHLQRTHASSAALTTLQGDSYALVMAFSANSLGTLNTLISKTGDGDASDSRWRITLSNQNNGEFISRYNVFETPAPGAGNSLAASTPYIIIYTFSRTGSNVGRERFYINGVLAAERTGNMPAVNTTADWILGATYLSSAYGNFFNGDIAYLAMYDTALTQTGEVAAALEAARSQIGWTLPTFETGSRVVCLGDSITWGTGSTGGNSYPAQLRTLLSRNIAFFNGGVPSERIASTLNHGAYCALDTTNVLILFEGSNNILNDAESAASVYAKFQACCTQARAAGYTKIGTFTALPRDGFSGAVETARLAFNTLLINGAGGAYHDVCWDAANASGLTDPLGPNYADGIHPNNAGYAIMANLAYADVRGWLPAVSGGRGMGSKYGHTLLRP